jgi:hypothetical protein
MSRHFHSVSNLSLPAGVIPDSFINKPDKWQGNGCRTKFPPRPLPAPALLRKAASERAQRAAKETRLAQSNADASEIQRQRILKKEYALWFAGMTDAERAGAHALGIRGPLPLASRPPIAGRDADIDFRDPAELPASSITANPVDILEPLTLSVEIERLSHTEIAATAGTFSEALGWALEGKGLVAMGERLCIMVSLLRPELASGLPLAQLVTSFCNHVKGDEKAYLACGVVFGRALEWATRGSSISALGERLYLVAYVLRPGLIDARTLANLGSMRNKTRQAKDKLAQCLRDTFAGLQARTMRGEITRARCRQSARANGLVRVTNDEQEAAA